MDSLGPFDGIFGFVCGSGGLFPGFLIKFLPGLGPLFLIE